MAQATPPHEPPPTLQHGDISAAWEDIVARLTDLGENVNPTSTPREVADHVDDAMLPLAVIYDRTLYSATTTATDHDVETATDSLNHTRTKMTTTCSPSGSSTRRLRAHYRYGELLPNWIKQLHWKRRTVANGKKGLGADSTGPAG